MFGGAMAGECGRSVTAAVAGFYFETLGSGDGTATSYFSFSGFVVAHWPVCGVVARPTVAGICLESPSLLGSYSEPLVAVESWWQLSVVFCMWLYGQHSLDLVDNGYDDYVSEPPMISFIVAGFRFGRLGGGQFIMVVGRCVSPFPSTVHCVATIHRSDDTEC